MTMSRAEMETTTSSKKQRVKPPSSQNAGRIELYVPQVVHTIFQEVTRGFGEPAVALHVAIFQRSILRFDVQDRIREIMSQLFEIPLKPELTERDTRKLCALIREIVTYMKWYSTGNDFDKDIQHLGWSQLLGLVSSPGKEQANKALKYAIFSGAFETLCELVKNREETHAQMIELVKSLLIEDDHAWNLKVVTAALDADPMFFVFHHETSTYRTLDGALKALVACRDALRKSPRISEVQRATTAKLNSVLDALTARYQQVVGQVRAYQIELRQILGSQLLLHKSLVSLSAQRQTRPLSPGEQQRMNEVVSRMVATKERVEVIKSNLHYLLYAER